jgi:FAD/FMN-containing dehydrogenase
MPGGPRVSIVVGNTRPSGLAAHERGVEALVDSYRRLPDDAPVRLAKPTSNLFRARDALAAPGLDVSGLRGVVDIDVAGATAQVQGMCTYERLVDATLRFGLMPLVVPQLRTITLGGAVAGLGIESTSFRSGLPHESVIEMDVLTGAGQVVRAAPGGPHADLFQTFPNSYGSLGYATKLTIELEPTARFVDLRHVRFGDVAELGTAVEEMVTGTFDGQPVDFIDGVVFAPDEAYLTVGRWSDEPKATSDYTRQQVYYRSVRERAGDSLTVYDYLWRWDTDWFWCSEVFGVQNPMVRRVWPRRWRRSDVYHRIVGFENRHGWYERLQQRRGHPPTERVVQDVEIPVDRLGAFLAWFDRRIGMRPVWLCPLRLREPTGAGSATRWPLYPLEAGTTYVNVGFWGGVPRRPGSSDSDLNRAVEDAVLEHGGHKSLYSDAYYDRDTFDALYNGPHLTQVRKRYDREQRLTGLYEKVVNRR